MGSDLLTSSRGPGVIGTLVALLVLVGFGALSLFIFDERFQGEGRSISSIIREEGKELENLQNQLPSVREQLDKGADFGQIAEEADKLGLRAKITAASLAGATTARDEAQAAVDALNTEIESYKQAYRESARAKLVGRTFDQLKTLSGVVYTNVKVTKADAVRIQLRHANGVKGVNLDDLPADLQEFLQVSKEEMAALLEQEFQDKEQHQENAELGAIQAEVVRLKRQIDAKLRDLDKTNHTIHALQARGPELVDRLRNERRTLDRDRRKSRTGGISDAPQIEVRIKKIQAQIAAVRQELPRAKQSAAQIKDEINDLEKQASRKKDEFRQKALELSAKEQENS